MTACALLQPHRLWACERVGGVHVTASLEVQTHQDGSTKARQPRPRRAHVAISTVVAAHTPLIFCDTCIDGATRGCETFVATGRGNDMAGRPSHGATKGPLQSGNLCAAKGCWMISGTTKNTTALRRNTTDAVP